MHTQPLNSNQVEHQAFDFELVFPQGKLSRYVQGLWSAFHSPQTSNPVTRWLQADACSGVMFVLSGTVELYETQYSQGTFFIPVSKEAHTITLHPNTQLVGIRFQPGIGMGVMTQLTAASSLGPFQLHRSVFNDLEQTLIHANKSNQTLLLLENWLDKEIDFDKLMPTSFFLSFDFISDTQKNHQDAPIGQRQTERLFKNWVGISPKMFQRIVRVKHTLAALKATPDISLVQLALEYGYADQAHMTREVKSIAKITPKHYCKLVSQNII